MFKKMSKSEYKDYVASRKDAMQEIQKDMLYGIFNNMEKLEEYLKFSSNFIRYSTNNTMLILHACPNATLVASFPAWRKMHRSVRKGEKGIDIWCPAPSYRWVDKEVKDDNGNLVIDPVTNKAKTEKVKVPYTSFVPGSVFDISQTDPDPDADDALTLSVDAEEPLYETEGDLYNALKCIDSTLSMTNSIDMLKQVAGKFLKSCSGVEKDAETTAVAYIAAAYLNLDTGAINTQVIASWGKGQEIDAQHKFLDDVRAAAHKFIAELDKVTADSDAA